MRRSNYLLMAVLFACVIAFAGSSSNGQSAGPPSSDISFTVSMPEPWTHLLRVEMRMQIPASLNVPNESDLVMPVWTPGSYLIREYERNVQDFAASDANDRALEWTKINKKSWWMSRRTASFLDLRPCWSGRRIKPTRRPSRIRCALKSVETTSQRF